MNHDDRNKKGGARRSRALVLGAGGPVGRTWQSGLIAGLIEREIDLGDASLIIGTSAGAIVGAQLALGLKFAAPSKLDLAIQAAPASSWSDLSGLLAAIGRAVRSSEAEIERAKIGAFAIEAQTVNIRSTNSFTRAPVSFPATSSPFTRPSTGLENNTTCCSRTSSRKAKRS